MLCMFFASRKLSNIQFLAEMSAIATHVRLETSYRNKHGLSCSSGTTKLTYRCQLQNGKSSQSWTFHGLSNLFRTTIFPRRIPRQNSGRNVKGLPRAEYMTFLVMIAKSPKASSMFASKYSSTVSIGCPCQPRKL
jgi:hypothetical protein